ncbi:twin transmembrane helix small protein [Sphingomonas sp. HMP6]|uniref:twin transmembrane helix small protein n=1 Tax=Sphingomonas sp. HMP6 TaxID=1517551 RepID=UPI0015965824|nr:twin transmembrane helix small protein [Sphingomonas sp. HMP6]BCA59783.1 membrane protein [Sphingomonas sp. HMP6]
MSTFLTILLIASMIAVVVVLVRGLIVFLLGASQDVREGATNGEGLLASATKSNKLMQYRVMLQAVAIFIVVLILFMSNRT